MTLTNTGNVLATIREALSQLEELYTSALDAMMELRKALQSAEAKLEDKTAAYEAVARQRDDLMGVVDRLEARMETCRARTQAYDYAIRNRQYRGATMGVEVSQESASVQATTTNPPLARTCNFQFPPLIAYKNPALPRCTKEFLHDGMHSDGVNCWPVLK